MTTSNTSTSNARPASNSFARPRDLLAESAGMSDADFVSTYSPTSGPIRLGDASAAPRGAGRHEFRATLSIGDSIRTASAVAFGPAEAVTSMLHDIGIHLEILEFHQQLSERGTATIVQCRSDSRITWAMGMGDDATASTMTALIAGANRLTGTVGREQVS